MTTHDEADNMLYEAEVEAEVVEAEVVEYQPLPDEEIKAVALGMIAGTVFTDRHLRSPEDISMVFPILTMMEPEMYQQSVLDVVLPGGIEEKAPTGMIYEFMDKAGPRSVNGYPMFYSVRVMSPEDLERVQTVVNGLSAVLGTDTDASSEEE